MNGVVDRHAMDAIDELLDEIAAALEEVRALAREMKDCCHDRPDPT